MKKIYQFEFNEEILSEESYGHGRDDNINDCTYLGNLKTIARTFSNSKNGNILEWGSGITSLMFADFLKERGHGNLITIDHNSAYLRSVCNAIPHKNILTALAIDTIGPRESQADLCLTYSTFPMHFQGHFDLIYIDGRRRMECALTAANICHEETIVVIHDYRRTRYQLALSLFDLVEDGPHFRILKVKPTIREVFRANKEKISDLMLTPPLLTSESGRQWVSVLNCAENMLFHND